MATNFAPYAPPSAVIAVIRHYRSRDVPERVTVTNLLQIGVTEALANRSMAALRFLGLIREDETTTDQFRALRFANDDQYQEVLRGILEAAYKGVLDHVDLASAGDRELSNAFIAYSPGGQRARMITLFVALAEEAGMEVASPAKASAPRAHTQRAERNIAKRKTAVPPKGRDTPSPAPISPREDVVAFGITDSDLAALPEAEFEAVWSALGKLARARARAARPTASVKEDAPEE